jgi:hypothetical protein
MLSESFNVPSSVVTGADGRVSSDCHWHLPVERPHVATHCRGFYPLRVRPRGRTNRDPAARHAGTAPRPRAGPGFPLSDSDAPGTRVGMADFFQGCFPAFLNIQVSFLAMVLLGQGKALMLVVLTIICAVQTVRICSNITNISIKIPGKYLKHWGYHRRILKNVSGLIFTVKSQNSSFFSNSSVNTASNQPAENVLPHYPELCRQNRGLCANKAKQEIMR